MFLTILAIVLTLGSVLAGLIARSMKKEGDPGRVADARIVRAGAIGAFVLAFILAGLSALTTVDAGEVKVPILFGEVQEPLETEGIHLVNPFARLVAMPVRTVEMSFSTTTDDSGTDIGLKPISALSSEGASVEVDMSLLYHVNPSLAGPLYRSVGTTWETTLLIPYTRSAARDCIPQFSFEEARTSARDLVSQCVERVMGDALSERGLVIEAVLIRNMKADARLQAAIDAKLEAQSAAQRAEFEQRQAVVEAATLIISRQAEADAKVIDAESKKKANVIVAQGEAEANRLVAQSLTPELLQLRIYETLGSKTVYLLGGGGVVPLLNLPGVPQ
jgi:regulator of protease activity HflC (stomatin/prohibitin superfamily)